MYIVLFENTRDMTDKTAVFLEYKALLFSMAYNMLGAVADAEDIVQDAYLKWMEMETSDVRHTKAYLVKIVTNQCINHLNSARMKREEYIGVWLPEPVVNYDPNRPQGRVELYHALSIGMMVLLRKLTPMERAIFLLKEVFAYDYYELAGIFDKSEDNCRQILKRAKDNLGKDAKRYEVDVKVHEKIMHKFIEAITSGNVEEFVGMLKDDVVFQAEGGGPGVVVNGQRLSATLQPVHGKENVSRLILATMPKLYQYVPGLRQEIVIANNLPATISYIDDEPFALFSIEPEGEQIRNIYVQTNPEKLKQFHRS